VVCSYSGGANSIMTPGILRRAFGALPFCGVFLFLSIVGVGCTTTRADREAYVKEGVPYGVTDGSFRGRWWSYYERGRSYQKGGFYPEAEKDFRIALRSRRADALWPRTYGMHFVPEYFPHRELGINLYYQEDLEGSIQELETSLGQQFSARAAHYFALAQRRVLEASGADSRPPTLEILTGHDNISTTQIELTGIARDDMFVAKIEVGGNPLYVRLIASEVDFSAPILLTPGQNTIPIRITDLAGNEFLTEFKLENDIDGPAVSFDGLDALPGVVSGKVFDPAGVSSLTIDDNAARLAEDGPGLFSFDVPVSASLSFIPFVCTDSLGNITRGQMPTGAPAPASAITGIALASSSLEVAERIFIQAAATQLAATIVSGKPIEILLENIQNGAQYYQDEIVIALNARSNEPIDRLTLLGKTIPVVPARNDVYVTRRVRLDSGSNELSASISDIEGNSADDQRTVSREQNALEINKNMLAVAIMPKSLPADTLTSNIISALHAINVTTVFGDGDDSEGVGESTSLADRFDLVNREDIAVILREQALNAELSSSKRALALQELIPFEVLLSVQASVDSGNLEIIVDGVSSETGTMIVRRVDVAGNEEDVDELVEQLVVRLLQEFPRAQGDVVFWNYPELDATLTEQQGTRRHRKCLVFRMDPQVHKGKQIGERPTVVAEGLISGVGSSTSSAKLVKSLQEDIPLKELTLEEGHFVVLK
jgi:hypothetical protein